MKTDEYPNLPELTGLSVRQQELIVSAYNTTKKIVLSETYSRDEKIYQAGTINGIGWFLTMYLKDPTVFLNLAKLSKGLDIYLKLNLEYLKDEKKV